MDLLQPVSAESLLQDWPRDTAIVVMSDGGATRARIDPVRLLDTLASLKGLMSLSSRIVWLNPVPQAAWIRTTAEQIARHIPMFPMDAGGMHRAVNVLRGQPVSIARPLVRSTTRVMTMEHR